MMSQGEPHRTTDFVARFADILYIRPIAGNCDGKAACRLRPSNVKRGDAKRAGDELAICVGMG
jgi:hypothetical protein